MTDDLTQPPAEGELESLAESTDLKEHGYYYNLETGQVEHGQQSMWTDRIGPYATREAAQRALETASSRSEAWDEEDRRWRGEDGG